MLDGICPLKSLRNDLSRIVRGPSLLSLLDAGTYSEDAISGTTITDHFSDVNDSSGINIWFYYLFYVFIIVCYYNFFLIIINIIIVCFVCMWVKLGDFHEECCFLSPQKEEEY